MSTPQFTLFMHAQGPNGWKVAFALEELGLTYKPVFLEFGPGKNGMKHENYFKYNPNGRIPAIIDHQNGDFVLWESCAILQYLVDLYDPEHKISATDAKDKYTQMQWLLFQASGQGPYYGQAVWFARYHPEKFPSAIERYQNETRRVLGVLERVLSKQEWLVGDHATVADISFIPWNRFAPGFLSTEENKFDMAKEFPAVTAWHRKLVDRPGIKKCIEQEEEMNKRKFTV